MIVSTTRPMSCLTLRSRSGVPIVPRKYLETTMLVACCDQNLGISTSRCSKTTLPFSLPMTAERTSHSISSNGSIPSRVKNRSYSRPGAVGATGADGRAGRLVLVDSTCGAAPLCIIPSEQREPPASPRPGPGTINVNWVGARERYEHGPSNGRVIRTSRELGRSRSVRCAGGQYGPCLQGCQGSIYQILCL